MWKDLAANILLFSMYTSEYRTERILKQRVNHKKTHTHPSQSLNNACAQFSKNNCLLKF